MRKNRNKDHYQPTVDATLDLHGCTREEARIEAEKFLDDCISEGMERIRIIVGKGTHSPQGAVLPNTIKAVLAQYNLSYTPAKLRDGGEGALEVLL